MKPVYRLSWCLRCGPTVGPLWFPLPPLQLRPIPATRRTHLKGFVFRADTRRWLARWRHSASGLHYQWRQCCVTHRERTSCFTTLLLFLFQPAAFALSFFPPHLQLCFVTVRKRCGAGLSTSLGTIVLLWTRLGLFPVSPFAADSSLGCWDQHLVGCYYGPCHPNPVSLRSVTDTSPLHMLPVLSFFCVC